MRCNGLGYANDVDLLGDGCMNRDNQPRNFKAAAEQARLKPNEGKIQVLNFTRNEGDTDFIEL